MFNLVFLPIHYSAVPPPKKKKKKSKFILNDVVTQIINSAHILLGLDAQFQPLNGIHFSQLFRNLLNEVSKISKSWNHIQYFLMRRNQTLNVIWLFLYNNLQIKEESQILPTNRKSHSIYINMERERENDRKKKETFPNVWHLKREYDGSCNLFSFYFDSIVLNKNSIIKNIIMQVNRNAINMRFFLPLTHQMSTPSFFPTTTFLFYTFSTSNPTLRLQSLYK